MIYVVNSNLFTGAVSKVINSQRDNPGFYGIIFEKVFERFFAYEDRELKMSQLHGRDDN